MDTSKNGGKYTLSKSHQNQIEEAGRYMSALELINTPEAMAQREKIRKQLPLVGAAVGKADQASRDLKEKKALAAQTDKAFDRLVTGVLAGLEVANPRLFAELPDRASFPSTDPDGYGEELVLALGQNHLEPGSVLAKLVQTVREHRLDAAQAYQQAYEAQPLVQQGRAAVSELGALLKVAEVIIHNSASPGSPAYQLLKKPKSPSKKAKKDAAGQPSPAPATTPAVPPVVHPAPAPAPVAAPASEPAVVANQAPASAVLLKVAQ